MKIYIYDKETKEIRLLEKKNLCQNTIIIDSDEVQIESGIAYTKNDILKLMKKNIVLKKERLDEEKKIYSVYARSENNIRKIKIPKDVISELIHTLGLIRVLKLENPVYTSEEFLKEINKNSRQKVILKIKNSYRTLENEKMVTINNIYSNYGIKLWEYQEENKLIVI